MLKPNASSPAAWADGRGRRPMRMTALIIWGLLALTTFSGFIALGVWQAERRAWKHELVERIETRTQAPATIAPTQSAWADVLAAPQDYEYLRVKLEGRLRYDQTTLVEANTVLGRGYWVMTPLQTPEDDIVFINRGFVPRAQPNDSWRDAPTPAQALSLTGLLRLSEPEGTFLRSNEPAQGLWYSRDVEQLASYLGLKPVAPYFIDVQAQKPVPPELTIEPPTRLPNEMLPVAGLTVIKFPDNHLMYMLTWFGLAIMVAAASAYVIREEYRLRRSR